MRWYRPVVKRVAMKSIDEVQDEIVAEMAGLDETLARYEYLVAQGRGLHVPEPGIRSDRHVVAGCQVNVWVKAELKAGRLHLAADSDALINTGIVALLLRVLDGRTPAEIMGADLYFLDRSGLRPHLSPARANGLAAVVERIRAYAAENAFAML